MASIFLLTVHVGMVSAALRPYTVNDLLALEQIDESAISPDGKLMAYTRSRSKLAGEKSGEGILGSRGRRDVWLADLSDGTSTNLTRGDIDGSTSGQPRWSPGGDYLSITSSKGGSSGRFIWAWNVTTRKMAKLSDLNVSEFSWIGKSRLAAVLEHVDPREDHDSYAAPVRSWATHAWTEALIGRQPTVSLLSSDLGDTRESRSPEFLVTIDVSNLNSRVLSTAAIISYIRASADGRYISYVSPQNHNTSMSRTSAGRGNEYQQVIVAVDEPHHVYNLGVDGFLAVGSFRWSRGENNFAYIAGPGEGSSRVIVGTMEGSTEVIPLTDPSSLIWLDDQRLLVHARGESTRSDCRVRRDWWLLSPRRSPRNITQKWPVVPERLRRLSNEVIVGVASGKLWRFNVSNGDLTSTSEIGWRGMTSISVESDDVAHGDEMPDVIVRGRDNRDTRDYRLDASTGRLSEVDCAVGSRLLAHSAVGQIVACYADGRNGAYLSVVKEGRESFNVSLNDGLIDVAESEVRTFDYRSQNGEQLEAAVMLPIGYEPGHRYPLVTWVYPGQSAADAVMQHKLNVPLFLNLQLLCARGYAVLIPSMPYDGGEEIYGRLTSGVLGALDAVIEMGIADSEKVAVMGHSGGGFAVYGLISQTTRFKVAIASAGPSNLISMYGSFGGGERYLRTGVMPWSVAAIEGGIFRLPPPWKKRWTYLLNSPTSFVDRIATPLLIIHGDLDFVPVTQADEMFVALERQGKRVRYARYLGEGHDLESPANIRDVWGQIYRWLSEYLG